MYLARDRISGMLSDFILSPFTATRDHIEKLAK